MPSMPEHPSRLILYEKQTLAPGSSRMRQDYALCRSRSSCYNENRLPSGSNSVVECQLPKLDVAGSNPVSRSIFNKLQTLEKAALLCTPLGCLSRRHPNNFLLS